MNLKRKAIFILLAGLAFLFFPLLASTQVSVTPLGFDIDISPGEESDVCFFEVINLEDDPLTVSVSLADWENDIYGGIKVRAAGTLPRSLAPCINFSPFDFVLNPGQKQKVNFTVNLPPEEKGPHWTIFLITTSASVTSEFEIEENKRIIFSTSVAYAVKVRQVDPVTARSEGKIVWADVVVSEGSETLVEVVADFENTGTTFLKVGGRIEFRDQRGSTVDTMQVRNFTVLPGAKRRIRSNHKKELPPGEYIALVILDFGGDYLVAGQVNFEVV